MFVDRQVHDIDLHRVIQSDCAAPRPVEPIVAARADTTGTNQMFRPKTRPWSTIAISETRQTADHARQCRCAPPQVALLAQPAPALRLRAIAEAELGHRDLPDRA